MKQSCLTNNHTYINTFIYHSLLSAGPDFRIDNQENIEEKLQLEPRFKKCKTYQEFRYVTRVSPGKYFAIWGCHQISESKCDRGLWVFGAKTNKTSKNVENAHQMITEALIDMKLDNQTRVWDNMIINVNKFQPQETLNCTETFFEQCESPTSSKTKNKKINLPLFVLLCVMIILSVTAILIICKCT